MEASFQGLENLGPTAVYEGWLMVNGTPVSSGRFSVDANGKPSQTSFDVSQDAVSRATAFILTIEPAVNDDPKPSEQHLVAGNFDTTRSATLATNHPAALGTDFGGAAGSFILATPTSAATTDDDQGIWFLKMVNGVAQAGLTIPMLPKGWVYEGWVVVNGKPVSTGRFTDPAMADKDGNGPAAGPLGGPPFPGSDFINPALKLPGGAAVISVEPEPDNSAAPFLLKPLIDTAISSAVGPTNNHVLANRGTSVLPTGIIKLVNK